MLGIKQDSTVDDHSPKTFVGVRFVLFGFDPIDAQKVRSKLVNGGGVGVGQYSPISTHVIVDKLIYDDPICVAARADGKILVTGLWVDHSFDIGMPVDSTSVMYRPLRDINGIPGAKSLIVCLTGYQRQDRDDIMTMVDLMGANFSKPLVANKVTHLICYKFEGEKYELAKKMKTIKLVNHRWLEDCLRAWEILPEGNYDTSGYELEMLEAEAKDSEEEAAQDNAKRQYDVSPHNLHISTERARPSPQSMESISRNLQAAGASRGSPSAWNNNDTVLFTAKEIAPVQASNLQDNYKKHLEELGSPDTRTARRVTCHESSEQTLKTYNRTPTSDKVRNDLSSSLGSAMKSHSDVAKLSTISYMRKTPRRNTLPVFSGEMASHLSSFSKVNADKFSDKDDFHISSFRLEQAEDGTDSGFVKTPSAETELRHEEGKSDNVPERMKFDVSYGSSKSQKTSHASEACIPVSPLVSNRTGGSEPAVSRNGMPDENAASNPLQSSSAAKCSHFDRKSLPKPIVNAVISESRQTNLEASQTSFVTLKKISSANEPDTSDAVNRADNAVSDVGKPQEELQDAEVPSSKSKSSGVEKSNIPSLNLSKGEDARSLSKPLRKKVISKKSLGSRPKLSPTNAKNKKCSIYLNKTASHSDAAISSVSGKETVDREMLVNCENRTPTADVDKAMVVETNNVAKPGNEVESKSGYMDDETEAPEDREEQEHEFETGLGKEKSMEADQSNKMNMEMKDKSDHAQTTAVKNDFNILTICDPMKALDENENGAELEKAVCDWKNKPNLSTSKEDSVKEKITKAKKCSLGKTLRKSVHSVTGKRKSMDCGNAGDNIKKKTENKEENSSPHSTGKSKKTVPVNKSENSMEVEKENRPVDTEGQTVSRNKQWTGKVASKLNRFPMKIDPKSVVSDPDSVLAKPKVKIEPSWFILSGHKLQRKEFQQVIRRLKGRICRDSHQWSYQATHFIVPDPIRRTEKFFAAAASGRWVLKTDYLTASNQAGRFLAEEPYEWHKKGLSEDGAINLEAPRKWRLLRERTGHGAFYGMRIVVYGECIAPPLDTLKRAIKAGDGTILATSPPYTRFLESGVDFAVVSPGMPRVDVWVQEFLRHEIPCVVADYLVEYVCKPGYSLERHVQYNTHAWAQRSICNLLSRAEEVIEEPTTPEDCVNNDLPCQVCGSRDRGEVMLICGDESGSTGCGVGMHIDCCNPPLENVPEEDWFCPKCSESINEMKRPKGTKKGTSSSKGK